MKRILLFCAALALVGCTQSPEQEAQALCRTALLNAVKNPTSAKIPPGNVVAASYLPAGEDFSVNWGRGKGLLLQNDFGAMIDSEAVCVVTKGVVTGLSFGSIE
jgi:hypothetical protein